MVVTKEMNTRNVIVGVALLSVGLVTAGFAGMVGSWVNTELISVGGWSVTPLRLSGVVVAALGASMPPGYRLSTSWWKCANG